MEIKIPELSLVALVGISGSGKSTFAKKHFKASEIVSSDVCRGIVSNDENDQTATNDAFDLLYYIVGKRLKKGLLTVIDATNIQSEGRKSVVKAAREYHCLPVAIVLNIPKKVCSERNDKRADRNFGDHVLRQQRSQLKRSIRNLKKEGFRHIFVLNSEEEVNNITTVLRDPLYSNKKHLTGPFDIIGDIHGCLDETLMLLKKLNYNVETVPFDLENYGYKVTAPNNRKVVFLGDLVDRGPNSAGVLKLAMSMVKNETAICVPGNHDIKLQKKLVGKNVNLKHGLAQTIEQLAGESEEFILELREFLYKLTSHYVLDDGKLVVAHAGIREEMQGRGSGAVRAFCLYGETTGEMDEFGLPMRYNWAEEYRGKAKVVYGHTAVPEAQWLNKTIDIDTGCVFGGKLTALKYPEEEIVSVAAKKVYCEPSKPLDHDGNKSLSHQHQYDDLLDISDVTGKRIVQTRLRNNITIREENSITALEIMSRFAVDPKWLIYLPPTMSPCGTSELPNYLEHPLQALNYYKKRGVTQVICEEKHMGSRAIVVVCKDNEVVRERFGIQTDEIGKCYTRTGRNFFNDSELEKTFLNRLQKALEKDDFWEKNKTDWVCLDTELMPWSAKAQSLLKDQYASVGAAASNALIHVNNILEKAADRNIDGLAEISLKYKTKTEQITNYQTAYRQYCWKVNSIEDYKLAPFHILATENAVHTDKTHEWHMESIKSFCKHDSILVATPYKIIAVRDKESVTEAVNWWNELTGKGGEGMVVKPLNFVEQNAKELLQPAIKCRGTEYLRIIYGPEYDTKENVNRLKNRGVSRKRSLAIREFALGIEGLERFVTKEPLRRVHESVFGVLALESEVVDPRL